MSRYREKLWQEDDATPGTEGRVTLGMAWRHLFGEELDIAKAVKVDGGDIFYYEFPDGRVAVVSYDGGQIWRK